MKSSFFLLLHEVLMLLLSSGYRQVDLLRSIKATQHCWGSVSSFFFKADFYFLLYWIKFLLWSSLLLLLLRFCPLFLLLFDPYRSNSYATSSETFFSCLLSLIFFISGSFIGSEPSTCYYIFTLLFLDVVCFISEGGLMGSVYCLYPIWCANFTISRNFLCE